jgi:ATP phosphoribosyltransferase regulatory subunit
VWQAGIELIGSDSSQADAEMVLVASEALAALGLTRLSFDLTLPLLAPLLLDAAGVFGSTRLALGHALDRKDVAAVAKLGGALAGTLTSLLNAAGSADEALDVLRSASLPPKAAALASRLADAVLVIRARAPQLRLTIDPLDCRSFRYHTGVYVTIYAIGQPEELGRGGRYQCSDGEPATGLSLFPEAVLRAAPRRVPAPRVFVAVGKDDAAAPLRRQGYATVAALTPVADEMAEARRLLCTHILRDGAAVPLSPKAETEPEIEAEAE